MKKFGKVKITSMKPLDKIPDSKTLIAAFSSSTPIVGRLCGIIIFSKFDIYKKCA